MISNSVIPRAAWLSGSDQAPKVISWVSTSRPPSSVDTTEGKAHLSVSRDLRRADLSRSRASARLRGPHVVPARPGPLVPVVVHAQHVNRTARPQYL